MALGGVEEGGVDDAVGHGAYAYVGRGVDADDAEVVSPEAARHFGGTDGHAVVVGVDEVGIGVCSQQRVGRLHRVFLLPVGGDAGEQGASPGPESRGEAVVPPFGGRGAREAVQLNHLCAFSHEVLCIAGSRLAQPHIVHADAGGVAAAVDVAVEDYHGNAALVHLFNNRRERCRLVGRHDENVELVAHEVADVFDLLPVAVVGRPDFHLGIFVEEDFAADFVVHLCAPVVLAALRHGNPVFFLFCASRQEAEGQQEQKAGKGAFHGPIVVKVGGWASADADGRRKYMVNAAKICVLAINNWAKQHFSYCLHVFL